MTTPRTARAAGQPVPPGAGTPAATPDFDIHKINPMALWREWVVRSEAQWSEALAGLLQDPRAAGPLNRQVEEARHAQRLFGEMAQGTLAMANLPSRSDIEALDERLGRVEDGLAALGAELVRVREALVQSGHSAAADAQPPRTRKAPVAAPGASSAPAAPSVPAEPAAGAGAASRRQPRPARSTRPA
ncbi:MAG: hypothetical protein JNL30_05385 [Rubrivivax sp.]|nr:hypothetical protein [Rubrivivax sp.]